MPEDKKFVLKIPKIELKRLKIKWPKIDKERRRRIYKIVFLAALFCGFSALGAAVGMYRAILQNLPDIQALEEFEPSVVTYVYSDSGEVIGEYAIEKRIQVAYGDIPDMLKKAIIATEDPRFYRHKGIDFLGILRAIKVDLKLILTPRRLHGGSTISQQLARRLFLSQEQTLRRKLKEAVLALQIEKRYSKEEILTLYCNQFNLANGRAYGIEAAARLYFDKSASELDLAESDMIAGIFRGPAVYFPYRNYDTTLGRRNHVINRMIAENYITPEEGAAVRQEPLDVLPLYRNDSEFAAYFLEEVRKYLEKNYGLEALYGGGLKVYTTLNLDHQRYAEAALKKQLRYLDKRLTGWRQDKISLLDKIEGDLEALEEPFWDNQEKKTWLTSWRTSDLQEDMIVEAVVLSVDTAEAEVKFKDYTGKMANKDIANWTKTRDLKKLIKRGDLIHVRITGIDEEANQLQVSLEQEPELDAAFLAITPQTGQVKAMVGGYSFGKSKWNNATQALRQAGSAIKPILYTAGIDSGSMSPVTTFIDEPTEFEDKWSGKIWDPPNYDEKYKGRVTLRQGIEESRNIVTAKLLEQISPQVGVDYCRRFGITSTIYPYLSLALGAFEVNLMELVSAFTVFPNAGVRVSPYYISRIEDRDGNILEEAQIETEDVISRQVAYIMTSLLQGVVRRGTAAAASRLARKMPLGGKTGTTDDHADARFVGFSPSLCAGVWVGYKEGRITIGDRQSGAVAALPIWIDFFDAVIAEKEARAEENGEEYLPGKFFDATNLSFVEIDRKTGLLPSPVCLPQFIMTEVFIPGTEPNRFCSNEDHMMTYDYYAMLRKKD